MQYSLQRKVKLNVTDLSLLQEFWCNNYAHVTVTAEADSLSTDAKQSLEDHGLVGCHSNKVNYLSVHARINSTGYVRLLWESNEEEDKGSHAAIFCEFCQRRRKDQSLIRVSGRLIRFSLIWSLLHEPLRALPPRTISCLLRLVFETP